MPFCDVTLLAKKPRNSAYPKKLVTLGDYLRKKRLDLELFQKDVALTIGVDTCTITNWEKGHNEPELRFVPKILSFLGYEPPTRKPATLREKILQYRYLKGVSQKKLAKEIGIDPGILSRLERNRGRCFPATIRKVTAFFERPGSGE